MAKPKEKGKNPTRRSHLIRPRTPQQPTHLDANREWERNRQLGHEESDTDSCGHEKSPIQYGSRKVTKVPALAGGEEVNFLDAKI